MLEDQPRTIRDAVTLLKRLLREDELEVIRNTKRSDLARFHFNHGDYIRNLWVHRGGSPVTQRINAAGGDVGQGNEFSQLVIEALWHDLNNRPFDLGSSEHFNRIVQADRESLAEELWSR
ncbi:MAG TPA: DUF6794 domain-containing protein [Longimicrobiales bacterium]